MDDASNAEQKVPFLVCSLERLHALVTVDKNVVTTLERRWVRILLAVDTDCGEKV